MRIERITDIQEVMRCLPFEREIRNKGRDHTREADMLLMLQQQLDNPLFGFAIVYDDDSDDIKGYGAAMINPQTKRAFILRLYSHGNGVTKMLQDTFDEWAKSYKINTMCITVFKNIKALTRRFGFKPVSVNMERRIKNG